MVLQPFYYLYFFFLFDLQQVINAMLVSVWTYTWRRSIQHVKVVWTRRLDQLNSAQKNVFTVPNKLTTCVCLCRYFMTVSWLGPLNTSDCALILGVCGRLEVGLCLKLCVKRLSVQRTFNELVQSYTRRKCSRLCLFRKTH